MLKAVEFRAGARMSLLLVGGRGDHELVGAVDALEALRTGCLLLRTTQLLLLLRGGAVGG